MSYKDDVRPYKPGTVSDDEIKAALNMMVNNPQLDTKGGMDNTDGQSLSLVSFQEKHLTYLQCHPKVSPVSYLANLKTMIKIRS